jgi:cell division protein FtsN
MSRPQARKMAQPKRRNGYKQRPGVGSGPWLIAGIFLALFILGLFYLHSHRKHHEDTVETVKATKIQAKHAHQAKATNSKQADVTQQLPQFDFYTMLPDMQVRDSETAAKSSATSAPVSQAKLAEVMHQYILQAGAFKRLADADKVRANLILQGYNVQIKSVQVNNVTWQRIIIGPYKSLPEAQQAQDKLAKAGVKSLLFQVA